MLKIIPHATRGACALLATALLSAGHALAQTPMPVSGNGTANRIPKWTGPNTQGDSIIAERSGRIGINTAFPDRELHIGNGVVRIDRSHDSASLLLHRTGLKTFMIALNASHPGVGEFFISDLGTDTINAGTRRLTIANSGNVGIGTSTPAEKLSVAGIVQSTAGGFRFPDGTVQTTAAVGSLALAHDATLTGTGTAASPLGIAVPLTLDGVIHSTTGGFRFPDGTTQTTAALADVTHDATLVGSGTQGSPLGVNPNLELVRGTITLMDADPSGPPGPLVSVGWNTGVFARVASEVTAVEGLADDSNGTGVRGTSAFGIGVHGIGTEQPESFAGYFEGDVTVTGTFSAPGGLFKIDHPLDPENRTLSHAPVEAPEMTTVYSGNVTTGPDGRAVVELPAYFEALNRDFRYQLTVIGQFAQAIVAEEIAGNRFVVETDKPGVKVSWQVSATRSDAWAKAYHVPAEQEKPEAERGLYLHPAAFGQPQERGVDWARHPELIQRRLEMRDRLAREPRPAQP
jgi:hypothetical protein